MEQMKLTEDMLRSAFQSLSDEMIVEWEKGAEIQHEFSDRFERRMKKLIRKVKNQEVIAELHSYAKPLTMIAAAALIVCIIFFADSMTARANPMLLFQKMEVILEDSEMYIYNEDLDSYCFFPYEPTYIPEGYTEVSRIITDTTMDIHYENKQGEKISWSQKEVISGMIVGINTECDEKVELEYAGEHINIYVLENGFKSLYYESSNSVFMMRCDAISVEDMYEMVKSMKRIDKKIK